MIKEIRFLPTGEIRQPKRGDWFLSAQDKPVCAAQDFITSRFNILKMVVIEDEDPCCRGGERSVEPLKADSSGREDGEKGDKGKAKMSVSRRPAAVLRGLSEDSC